MNEDEVLHIDSWIWCSNCNRGYPTDVRGLFQDHFLGRPIVCQGCGAARDWWREVLAAVREHFMLTGAFHAIGAKTTVLRPRLQRGVAVTVDLAAYQIPENAIVLHSNFTGSPLFPMRWQGNVPRHDPLDKKWMIYGAPIGTDATEGEAQLTVTWIAPDAADTALLQLVDAAMAYAEKRYQYLVLPANVAVESELSAACYAWLAAFCSKDRARQFLEDGATYAHQLNILLPAACRDLKFVDLPEHLVGKLNRLRKLRNDVVHRGKLNDPLDQATAAELLSAAIFGAHYIAMFRGEIDRQNAAG
jgi:hypothetical protein